MWACYSDALNPPPAAESPYGTDSLYSSRTAVCPCFQWNCRLVFNSVFDTGLESPLQPLNYTSRAWEAFISSSQTINTWGWRRILVCTHWSPQPSGRLWLSLSETHTPSAFWQLLFWCCHHHPMLFLEQERDEGEKQNSDAKVFLSRICSDDLQFAVFDMQRLWFTCRGRHAERNQRFAQLVLGLQGNHCVQIFCTKKHNICQCTDEVGSILETAFNTL